MNSREMTAGLVCTIAGAVVLLLSRGYKFGTAADIGPGLFPAMAATLLCSLGVVILAGARSREQAALPNASPRQSWRAPLAVSAAVAAFALSIERTGFLVAAPVLILLASRGDPRSTPSDTLKLAVLLTVAAALIFVWALGLPLPLVTDPFRWK